MLDEILQLRLANQHLACPRWSDPTRLVAHFGGVQSQDFGAALWAVGQRLVNATAASLESAFDTGAVLRTHVLRPTWHLVAPADIRWMLALTGPRIKRSLAFNDRALGIDAALIARTNATLARALGGSNFLTRPELDAALRRDGITPKDPQTLGHIVAHAELDGVMCSGPRRGKQLTYALLDERVPAAAPLDSDAALAELTRRYFTSHGPATVRDCGWWSGLTAAAVRRGIEMNATGLARETVGGLTYIFASTSCGAAPPSAAYVLPNFDEYTVAYKDRDLYFDASRRVSPGGRDDVPFGNAVVLDGRVAGFWRRALRAGTANVEINWFDEPSLANREAVEKAVERRGAFLGVRAALDSEPRISA